VFADSSAAFIISFVITYYYDVLYACVYKSVCVCVYIHSWLVCGTAAINKHSPLSVWHPDRYNYF